MSRYSRAEAVAGDGEEGAELASSARRSLEPGQRSRQVGHALFRFIRVVNVRPFR